jgi:hypothetical protein
MKTSKLLLRGALALLAITSLLSSCKNAKPAIQTDPPAEENALTKIFLPTAPAGAVAISQAIIAPKPGEAITISGEIMGSLNPFIDGRAMLVLGDPTKLTPCNRMPGDACATPWDTCCDDHDIIASSIATIQILDEDGSPLKTGLKGFQGIKELAFLTVTGTIAEGSNPKNLLINATGIHVAKESPFKDAPPVAAAEIPE